MVIEASRQDCGSAGPRFRVKAAGVLKKRARMVRGIVEGECVTDLAGWGSDPLCSPFATAFDDHTHAGPH